jgi:Flp pilus assembly pilin Flp
MRSAGGLKLRAQASDVEHVSRLESLWTCLWVRLVSGRGQTMAEYAVLIAVIALIVVVAAVTLGGSLSGLFNGASHKV